MTQKLKKPAIKDAAESTNSLVELASNVTAIIKADSQILSNALEKEDSFSEQDYGDNLVQPEISPEKFYSLLEQNNTLSQCVSAMEVNIDGTGYDICRSDDTDLGDEDEKMVQDLKDFFSEVYPMMSLTTCRRQLRRHIETAGYGGIEVIRNPNREIVFFKPLDSQHLRLRKLEQPVTAKKTILRGGVEVYVNLQVRERVFVQKINEKKVYFKEFGASRDLDKKTGKWSVSGQTLPSKDRASEVIYFTVNKSSGSSYGIPRWVNQLPSVLGSRSAEELNLEYFNSGGIPPVMVFVSGGQMAEAAKDSLNALLTGKAKDKLRGLVADIHSSSGTVDKASGVSVQVESFDSSRQNDSMFENYDEKCEKRVRSSFRLPPLFVGKADDYSYASVFASYTLAEAQVFNPERDEFDELFNATIMRDLTGGDYKIKSKPLTVADGTNKLEALKLASEQKVITKNQLIDELNTASDLNISLLEDDEDLDVNTPSTTISLNSSNGTPANNGTPVGSNLDVTKSDLSYLGVIADGQVKNMFNELGKEDKKSLVKTMGQLNQAEKNIVLMIASAKVYSSTENDPAGMAELCGCVSEH